MRKTILTGLMLLLVLVGLYFATPLLLKYYIEKNSKKLTGRAIRLESVGLNPLEGILYFNNISMFEKDDQTLFAKCEQIKVDVDLWKGLENVFYLEALEFRKPYVSIVQNKSRFNYDDLIEHLNRPSTPADTSRTTSFYEIKEIALDDAQITYRNTYLNSLVQVTNCNIKCPVLTSESPSSMYSFDLSFTGGGSLNGDVQIDLDKHSYETRYNLQKFNLGLLYPYVKEYMDVVKFSGRVSGVQTLSGNWDHPEAIALKGSIYGENLVLTDNRNEDLVKAETIELAIDTLNVKEDVYAIRSALISKPYLRLELYKEGTNFDKLMSSYSQDSVSISTDSLSTSAAYGNIFGLLAAYFKTIAKEYSISNYKIENLLLENGSFAFRDFTLHRKFEYEMTDLRIAAERLNSKDNRIKFVASSTLNMHGKLNGEVAVDPKKYEDMEIHYTIDSLHVTDFNPYTDYYVAHPFLAGNCSYESTTSIHNRFLKSENKIVIESVMVGKKEKNSTAINLPVRLAVALLRDVKGDINIVIPIEGDLSDPKYKLGKVIWGVIVNLLKKTAAAPGKLLARKARMNENFLRGFAWQPLQSELSKEQKKSLDAIAEAVEKSPGIEVELLQVTNEHKEIDALAVYTTKKMYLESIGKLSPEHRDSADWKLINDLSVSDSLYNQFLDAQITNAAELQSAYEKSILIIGEDKLHQAMEKLREERSASLREYLSEAKGLDETQFEVITSSKNDSDIPYEEPSRCVSKFGAKGG